VFGLMAFGVAGANAEIGARWLLTDEKTEKLISFLPAEINLKADTTSVLHGGILGIEVLFLCPTIELKNAKLQEEGIIGKEVVTVAGLKEGRGSTIKFSNCTTDLNKAPASECTPEDKSAEGGPGTIVTKPLHALLRLHELKPSGVKDDILEVLPDTGLGGTFAVIQLPAACPIGTSVPVIGSLSLKDCKDLALTHLIEHLVEAFTPLTKLFFVSGKFGNEATFSGSSWAFLQGVHKGLKFNGDPA
jgi:hypothetical protein